MTPSQWRWASRWRARSPAIDEVEPFELPEGRVVTGTRVGPYKTLAETYEQFVAWTRAEGLTLAEGTLLAFERRTMSSSYSRCCI